MQTTRKQAKVTDDQYVQLKPPHLVTALRSFPRRYREALAAAPPEPELLVQPVDGHTVLALVADSAHSLELLAHAIEQTLVHDRPSISPTSPERSGRPSWGSPRTTTSLLEELSTQATALADRLDRAATADWSRVADADGREVRVVDLARDAVRIGAENLRLLERVVAQLPRG
jgi:hypothetical protein